MKLPQILGVGAALASAGAIAACSTAAGQPTRTPQAQQDLAKALAGRAAGKPVSCIPNYRNTNMQVIDDWTILFRDGRTVYVQNPRGGCGGLGTGRYTLVTRLYGTGQLCSGDINRLVDLPTGIQGGACVFAPFVPYTKQKS